MASRLRDGGTRTPVPRWLPWVVGAVLLIPSSIVLSGVVAVAQSAPSTERVKSFVALCKGVNPDCTYDIQSQFNMFVADPRIRVHQRELVVTPSGAMVLMVFYTEAPNKP